MPPQSSSSTRCNLRLSLHSFSTCNRATHFPCSTQQPILPPNSTHLPPHLHFLHHPSSPLTINRPPLLYHSSAPFPSSTVSLLPPQSSPLLSHRNPALHLHPADHRTASISYLSLSGITEPTQPSLEFDLRCATAIPASSSFNPPAPIHLPKFQPQQSTSCSPSPQPLNLTPLFSGHHPSFRLLPSRRIFAASHHCISSISRTQHTNLPIANLPIPKPTSYLS